MNETQFVERKPRPQLGNLVTVCFRLTRSCNLHCSYCQAPPSDDGQSHYQLLRGLKWLKSRGMKSVKFTGGEPFAYKYLPELVRFAYTLGIEPTIVTNGTLLAEKHIHFLRETGSRIKISIHGPKQIHNSMQGAEVFDRAVETLQMLIRLGIETSVHTLVRRNNPLNYDDWIKFLANEHVNKVSFIPFITRGRGKDVSPEWSLTEDEIELLKGSIQELQNRYRNKIKVRYIDFLNQAYFVFESNGNLILESSNEENDVLLCHASEICL